LNISNCERNVTTVVADSFGLTLPIGDIQSAQNYLKSYREINFNVNAIGPSYLLIDISYIVVSAMGYSASNVQSSILTNLTRLISPASWGSTNTNINVWDSSQTTINYLDVVGLIDDADGIANIQDVQIGLHGGSLGTSSIFMTPGIAVLPILATVTGNVIPSTASIFELSGR
jgi:hypothetical protein